MRGIRTFGGKKKAPRAHAGSAGLIATFLIAIAGILAGAFSAYVGEQGAAAKARRMEPTHAVVPAFASTFAGDQLRDVQLGVDATEKAREAIVRRVIENASLERLPAPEAMSQVYGPPPGKPKIIVIFDDIGIDKRAFDQVMKLPGPVTVSFLPYAKDVDRLAAFAKARGDAIMLHLPMEPVGDADPGPNALYSDMSEATFRRALEWNLDRFNGYVGVNNHMGSRLTANERLMKIALEAVAERGLFFLDSVTTHNTVARRAGKAVGAEVFSRDVFIDAHADRKSVIKQLAQVEAIARETGYVVAIAHPYAETIDVIGPWLTSAPMRGFELAPITALVEMKRAKEPPVVAAAPELRL